MKYLVIRGIANDKKKERFKPGQKVTLKGWTKKAIDHLLAKGAIEVIKNG